MPYKIIQTHEKGKPVLTAVPYEWEKSGTLFWPKTKAEKLLKIEFSHPEDNWIPIPCTVKRNYINTYNEAENEISSMLYRSDTEIEEQQQRQTQGTAALSCSLNELAEQCLLVPGGDTVVPTISNDTEDNNVYILSQETYAETPFMPPAATPSEDFTEILKTIKENQDKAPPHLILKKLQSIDEKQDNILLKLADFSVQFNELFKDNPTVRLLQNVDNFSPIDNKHELENLENDLKNEDKKNQIYQKYSVVCKGKDKGLNCAYTLIDVLFIRKFLTKCSWAGGCRGEESKIAFKTFKNTISLFYNLIFDCDKSFSVTECNTFLKNILRNSTRRNESKFMRTPACKTRQKNKTQINEKEPKHKENFDFDSEEGNKIKSLSSKYKPIKKIPITELNLEYKNIEESDKEINRTKIAPIKMKRREMPKPEYNIKGGAIKENHKRNYFVNIKEKKKENLSTHFESNNIRDTNTSDSDKENDKESERGGDIGIETKFEHSVKKIQMIKKKSHPHTKKKKNSEGSAYFSKMYSKNIYIGSESESIEDSDEKNNRIKMKTDKIQEKETFKTKANLEQRIKEIEYGKYDLDNNNGNKATASSFKLKPNRKENVNESDSESEMEKRDISQENITVHEREIGNEKDEEILDETVESITARVCSKDKENAEISGSESSFDKVDKENKEDLKQKPKKMQRREKSKADFNTETGKESDESDYFNSNATNKAPFYKNKLTKKLDTESESEKESKEDKNNRNELKTELTLKNIQNKETYKTKGNLKQGTKEIERGKYYLDNNKEKKATATSFKLKPKKKVNVNESEMEGKEKNEDNIAVYVKEFEIEKDEENQDEIVESITPTACSRNKRHAETSDTESNFDKILQEEFTKENFIKQKPKKIQKR